MPHTVTSRDLDTENPIKVYLGCVQVESAYAAGKDNAASAADYAKATAAGAKSKAQDAAGATADAASQAKQHVRRTPSCCATLHACMHVFSLHVHPLQHTFPQRVTRCDPKCCHQDTRSLALLKADVPPCDLPCTGAEHSGQGTAAAVRHQDQGGAGGRPPAPPLRRGAVARRARLQAGAFCFCHLFLLLMRCSTLLCCL